MGKGEIGMKKTETNKRLKYYCSRQRQRRERGKEKRIVGMVREGFGWSMCSLS